MIFCVVLEVGTEHGLGGAVGMDKCAPKFLCREKSQNQSSQHWKGLGNTWKRGASTGSFPPSPASHCFYGNLGDNHSLQSPPRRGSLTVTSLEKVSKMKMREMRKEKISWV